MAEIGILPPSEKWLSRHGTITQIISPTVFLCSDLGGLGDSFSQNFYVQVVRKGTGTGAAPQGDYILCTAYVSSNGRFTIQRAPSSAPLAVGDEIYILDPVLMGSLYVLVQPSTNVKQTSDTEANTPALVYTKVKELAFTGAVGGARISFDLRVDALGGTASAVVYKNGVAVTTNPAAVPIYTEWTDITGTYQTFTQDISGLVVGDLIQIYAHANALPRVAFVRNFRISYDIVAHPSVMAQIEAVYFDSINGTAGTDWPIGTVTNPVNNWADAQTIAENRNLTAFKLVHGVITLTANIVGFKFIGNQYADPGLTYIDNCVLLSGFTATKCTFLDINIFGVGTSTLSYCGGFINASIYVATMSNCYYFDKCYHIYVTTMSNCNYFDSCGTIIATNMNSCSFFNRCLYIRTTGAMYNCSFFSNCGMVYGNPIQACHEFADCGILWQPTTMDFTLYGVFYSAIRFFGLPVTFTNLTAPGSTIDISGDFTLTIAASCTAGTINVYGNIHLINNALGTVVNDYTVTGSAAIIIVLLNNLIAATLVGNETGGTLTTDGLVQILWENNAPFGYFEPLVLKLNFTNQTAAETVIVRIWERLRAGGGLVEFDHQVFAGVQDPLGKYIDLKPNRFGVRVTLERTAGIAKDYEWEIMRRE